MGGSWRGVGVQNRTQNSSDRYAVAVKNEGTIIEHLPQNLLRVCSLFLRHWTGKRTVASVSIEREHVEWRGV